MSTCAFWYGMSRFAVRARWICRAIPRQLPGRAAVYRPWFVEADAASALEGIVHKQARKRTVLKHRSCSVPTCKPLPVLQVVFDNMSHLRTSLTRLPGAAQALLNPIEPAPLRSRFAASLCHVRCSVQGLGHVMWVVICSCRRYPDACLKSQLHLTSQYTCFMIDAGCWRHTTLLRRCCRFHI